MKGSRYPHFYSCTAILICWGLFCGRGWGFGGFGILVLCSCVLVFLCSCVLGVAVFLCPCVFNSIVPESSYSLTSDANPRFVVPGCGDFGDRYFGTED